MSYAYLPRIADKRLVWCLTTSGAVQIEGPKWCGKTSTGEQCAKSSVFLQDPDVGPALLALADSKPSAILEGDKPRLIDEWQMAPQIWDAVRFSVDQSRQRGQYILTGSATPKKRPAHSGVGRIARLRMRTMSLFETGESTGAVSLRKLFETASAHERQLGAIAKLDVDDLAYVICRGGWPQAVTENDHRIALAQASNYVAEMLDSDIDELEGKRRNSTWLRAIMRSYARNISTEASLATIRNDMQGDPPSDVTVAEYIDALKRAFVIDDMEAWSPKLRSKTAVRTSPTRHFCDPSIAAVMLGATPEMLMGDFDTFGLLFESLCVHDLRAYADALDAEVRHYRDKTGLEADAVIILPDGQWAAIEVKMGNSRIDEGAKHLLKLANRVASDHEGEPAFLMVLTSTQTAYQRDDGVLVVPLATLAP